MTFDATRYWEKVNESRRSPEYLRDFYSEIKGIGPFKDAETEDRADQLLFIRSVIQENKITRVLDAGCGPGFWFQLWKDLNLSFTGVDQSYSAVKRARDFAVELGLNGTVEQAKLFSMPFSDKEFDAVFSVKVLLHTPPEMIVQTIEELSRVAKMIVLIEMQFSRPMILREHVFQHNYESLAQRCNLKIIYSSQKQRNQHYMILE